MANVGFIGLGIMGTAMTLRLLERGWSVTVWNLEPERVSPLVAAGAVSAPSPAAVADACDIVIMCVLDTEAVRGCVFGAQGIAEAARAGKILLDHSTIDPAATRSMAQTLQSETGMHWVDAPMSGGPLQSRAGTLTVMAGGDAADIEAIRPMMADLAANFTHMGPCGDSSLLKQLYPQMQARDFEPPRSYARQLLKDLKAVTAYAHDANLRREVDGDRQPRAVRHLSLLRDLHRHRIRWHGRPGPGFSGHAPHHQPRRHAL